MTGSSSTGIQSIIGSLGKYFSLKNLGLVHHFLRIEIAQTSHGLYLHQKKYATDILAKVSMTDAKPCPTPMVSNILLSKFQGSPLANPHEY